MDDKLFEERQKRLMKKLYKIKLNKRLENTSFCEMTKFFESRLRRLRGTNTELAKALADQRQTSQSWYEEVVNLKAELQESNQKLLKYQLAQSGSYNTIIKNEVDHKLKEICEPLEILVDNGRTGILNLAENIAKIKALLSTVRANNGPIRSSLTPKSPGSRPPLSKTPRSPRKNVVHPMVEGHVLQPASIAITRVSLEDQQRYQSSGRQNGLNLSVIGEVSSISEETSPHSSESEEVVEIEGIDENSTEEHNDQGNDSSTPSCAFPSDQAEAATPESPNLHYPLEKSDAKGKHENSEEDSQNLEGQDDPIPSLTEDPLEGPSWLYKKRGRGKKRKSKRTQTRKTGNKKEKNYNPHLGMYSDSDSDDDGSFSSHKSPGNRPKSKEKRVQICSKSSPIHKSPNDERPSFSLEDHTSRVSKRRKKSSKSKCVSDCKSSENDGAKPLALESFIITDDTTYSKLSPHEELEVPKSSSTTPIASISPSINLDQSNNDEVHNFHGFVDTKIQNDSMEMTECVVPLAYRESNVRANCNIKDQTSRQIHQSNFKVQTRKFFSTDAPQPPQVEDNETTPYDLSLIDASINMFSHPLKRESVTPPKAESPFNLRDVSIVVKDILKESPKPDLSKANNSKTEQEFDNDKENYSPIKSRRGRKKTRATYSRPSLPRKSSRGRPKISAVAVSPQDVSPKNQGRRKKKTISFGKISSSMFRKSSSPANKKLPRLDSDSDLPLEKDNECVTPLSPSHSSNICPISSNLLDINKAPENVLIVEQDQEENVHAEVLLVDLDLEDEDPLALPTVYKPSPRKVLDPLSNKSLPACEVNEDPLAETNIQCTGRPKRCSKPTSFKEPPRNRKIRQGDVNTSSIYSDFIPLKKSKPKKV